MDKIKSFVICTLLAFTTLHSWSKEDFAYGKDWLYQDLWINGEVLFKGCGPDCASRFEAIRPVLEQFERPFTILEIGANNGYFCLRAAHEYNATCVMIDSSERLKKICEANSHLNRLIYLKKHINEHELEDLAKREHFDVVLCFHVLHHVNWKPFLHALFKLGDHVIIETPPENDGFVHLKPTIPKIARHLLSLPNKIQIGSFQRQSPNIMDHMFLFTPQKSSETPEMRPGILMSTFRAFNGAFPKFKKREKRNIKIVKGS